MTAPTVPAKNHLRADALIAVAGLLARDLVVESAGFWQIAATDEGVVADIVAGLDHVVESQDPDTGRPVWSGFLLGQVCYVRLAPEPSMAELAAAILTPDAERPCPECEGRGYNCRAHAARAAAEERAALASGGDPR